MYHWTDTNQDIFNGLQLEKISLMQKISLDNFDISDKSGSSDSSDTSNSRQEQTCVQDFATVWISSNPN